MEKNKQQKKEKQNKQEIKDIIEELFYNNPAKLFHIREISRLTKIPKSTVALRIKELQKEHLVKEEMDVFKAFKSTDPCNNFRRKKTIFALKKIYKSEIIDFLEKETRPNCIILFGSTIKGEYNKNSDIDIFVNAKEQKLNVSEYEKKLGKNIQLFFFEDMNKIPKNLKNNIANGFTLSGIAKFF